MTSADTLGRLASRLYPAAQPDGVVVEALHNVTPIEGRIYKSAPTTQSAALFCLYGA